MSEKITDPLFAEFAAANPINVRRLKHNVIEVSTPVPGLVRNGLDDSWTHKKSSELSPEERELRRQSDKLRHQLKRERIHQARPTAFKVVDLV